VPLHLHIVAPTLYAVYGNPPKKHKKTEKKRLIFLRFTPYIVI